MPEKRQFSLFGHVPHEWRDHILTGVTLLLMVHLFVISPLELHSPFHVKPVGTLFLVLLGVGLVALARGMLPLVLVGMFGGLLALAFYFENHGGYDSAAIGMRAGAWVVISVLIIWIVMRAVYAPGPITYRRVVGAVLLYITVGIFFVAVYVMVAVFVPDAFRGITLRPRASLPSDFVYFSFVTLTTVGYGDIVPVDPLVRSLCNLEAVIGQLFPATILARLVSDQVSTRNDRPSKDPP